MTAKTKIIVVVNQKGGVGKSTVAFHLAHFSAINNKRVLCLDLDGQGNFSQFLTGDLDVIKNEEHGVSDLLEGVELSPTQTTHPDIELLHATNHLDRYDQENEEVFGRGYNPAMRELLLGLGYDYIIIDTPGFLGFRTYAALSWADTAVIPMDPGMTGIAGFQDVLEKIEKHISLLNPSLKWLAVLSRVDMRIKSHHDKENWLKARYGKHILPTLATRAAVAEAMEESPALPVWKRRGVSKELRATWLNFCKLVIAG